MPIDHGLLNCSFLKNLKNPNGITNCAPSAIQNQTFPPKAFPTPAEKSGKTCPGPSLSGAVALANIVINVPRICATIKVTAIWILVRVCKSIIPNPTP